MAVVLPAETSLEWFDEQVIKPAMNKIEFVISAEERIIRLRNLITVLQEVADKKLHFTMYLFISHSECGTSACALGWAALDPEFNKKGLNTFSSGGGGMIPFYKCHVGLIAAREFFNLTNNECNFVFTQSHYDGGHALVTPEHVIEHINKVINRYQ